MDYFPRVGKDGLAKLNENYKGILRLESMLCEAGIPYEIIRKFDGWQIWYPSASNHVADAIEHFCSYGSEDDKLEIMGLLTEEEEKSDSVLGWLTAEEVFERIEKHYLECIASERE